jgi:DNA-binding CsgD family transcriptional regulator
MATTLSAASCRVRIISLTRRELEVLTLIVEGKSSKEVAHSLFLSKRTVDFHLARIYGKLNVSNRVHAIRRAYELGLVAPALLAVA